MWAAMMLMKRWVLNEVNIIAMIFSEYVCNNAKSLKKQKAG
jgi:hypothetical protein